MPKISSSQTVDLPGISPIPVIRSDRRTVAVQIGRDGKPIIRAPRRMSLCDIRTFAASHKSWIEKHIAAASAIPDAPPLTAEELKVLAGKAKTVLGARIAYFAPLVGVSPSRVTIRSQRSRWGSCSSKGSISLNCLLMLVPPEVADSVVVHELCHMKHMDHSARFYAEVLRVMPDYRERDRWLRQNGGAILARLG